LVLVIALAIPILVGNCVPDSRPGKAASRSGARTEAPAVVVDIRGIAGKSQAEVARVLGEPTASETTRHGGRNLPKMKYRGGDIEIVFVDGKADWITVFGKGRLPFDTQVLGALGLPSTRPSFSSPSAVIRWENIPGVREVSVFPGQGGRAHYAYISVRTAP
jgi:hypothetical protein